MGGTLRFFIITITLFSILILLFMLSISMGGFYKLSITDIVNGVLGGNSHGQAMDIVVDMRMRRALTAIAVGAIMGVSSISLQNILRNPLASPFTLGIQSAAALGVGISMSIPGIISIIGKRTAPSSMIMVSNYYVVVGSAFSMAMIQSLLILFLSYAIGLSIYGIILASIALSFATQALLALLQYLYFNEIQVATLLFWTFGDVGRTTWTEVWILLMAAIIGVLAFLVVSTDLDLVMFGDEVALSSGVNVKFLRILVLVVSSLLTAISVSLVGVIGFAGLVASHIARLTIGWSSRRCIILSSLYGAIIVLLADFVGRTVLNPVTLPAGIMTLMVGGRSGVVEDRWG